MKWLAFLAAAASAFAAVDGTVVNGTTGKPQPNVVLTLFKLGGPGGPQYVAATKTDAQGRFTLPQDVAGAPALLEAGFEGVSYNHMIPPGTASTGVQIQVYASSNKPGAAAVAQHMVLLEPTGPQVNVSETYFFKNDGKETYNDPKNGTLRFSVPAGAEGSIRVQATAPQGMPVQRTAEPAGVKGVYKLDFPIKPGETRIDIGYSAPAHDPVTFESRVFYKGAPTRLVVPSGVTLAGDGLKSLGNEPQTQAAIYEVNADSYKVTVQGTGSLRAAGADDSGDDASGPQIQSILPRIYDRVVWILIPAFAVLILGFVLLYRKGAVSPR